MEGETEDTETPQPPSGPWPAEVWLAGEDPREEGQAGNARETVTEKIQDVKEKLDLKVEDIKESIGPHLENARDKLAPRLEKAQGKFGQAVGNLRGKLFRKK